MGKDLDSSTSPHWRIWIRSIPGMIASTIALVTAIVGFVLLLQENFNLLVTIFVALILGAWWTLSLYMWAAQKPSALIGGQPTPLYPRGRKFGWIGMALVPVIVILLFAYEPSRAYTLEAILGEKTKARGSDSLKLVDVVLLEDKTPIVDIKVRNTGEDVAFLKEAQFHVIESVYLRYLHEDEDSVGSPSAAYDVGLIPSDEPYVKSVPISQVVAPNEVDRFQFKVGSVDYGKGVSLFRVEIVLLYNETDEKLYTGEMLILAPLRQEVYEGFNIPEEVDAMLALDVQRHEQVTIFEKATARTRMLDRLKASRTLEARQAVVDEMRILDFFQDALLSYIDLASLDLQQTNLKGVVLRGANLQGADLTDADG